MKTRSNMGMRLLDMFVKMQQEYPEMSPDRVLIIDTEILKEILTPARVKLINAIRDHDPKSVTELSRILHRPQESVSRDLTILNNYGVLDFVRSGKVRKPELQKDIIAVPC